MHEKRKLGYWWFGLIPVGLVALIVVLLLGPNPTVVISPQTTHITTPLGPDGFPDYAGHLLIRGQTGVTPENNAAVLIWQATWPGELRREHYELMCEALGMELPSATESLVSVFDESVLEQLSALHPDASEDGDVTDNVVVQMALRTGWTTEQLPVLSAWANSNKTPLDLLVEGANRPRYYSPSPSFLEGKDDSLIATLLPGVHGLRDAARCLVARAMWHVGEGRSVEAWRDLRAAHLIARHACRGVTLVEHLVGIAIESMACSGTQTLLHHGDLSREQAALIMADLKALPSLPVMWRAMDEGERVMFLDSTMRLATGKLRGSDLRNFGVTNDGTMAVVTSTRIDWNIVLRKGNQWYDRLVKAGKLPRTQRLIEIDNIDRDLGNLDPTNKPMMLVGGIVARSEFVADTMLMLFLPALGAATNAGDRATVQLELTRVAAALAGYRATHKQYPEELAALLPEHLDAMPMDLYSANPFLYERRGDGYLLYSVFENGADNEGTDFGGRIVKGEWVKGDSRPVDRAHSDLVVRVPRENTLGK